MVDVFSWLLEISDRVSPPSSIRCCEVKPKVEKYAKTQQTFTQNRFSATGGCSTLKEKDSVKHKFIVSNVEWRHDLWNCVHVKPQTNSGMGFHTCTRWWKPQTDSLSCVPLIHWLRRWKRWQVDLRQLGFGKLISWSKACDVGVFFHTVPVYRGIVDLACCFLQNFENMSKKTENRSMKQKDNRLRLRSDTFLILLFINTYVLIPVIYHSRNIAVAQKHGFEHFSVGWFFLVHSRVLRCCWHVYVIPNGNVPYQVSLMCIISSTFETG